MVVPEDLIVEILLRLPVKSLICLKLVCKGWYDLIKTNNFKSIHHKFNLSVVSQSRLLMCSSPKSQVDKSINNHVFAIRSNDELFRVLSPDFGILANKDTYVNLVPVSCNGIVCYYDDYSNIFLSNPATREFKQLPPTSFEIDISPKFYRVGVAFGFSSSNIYDLKVLRFFVTFATERGIPEPKPTDKAFQAEIFTLSTNTWKQLHWGLDDQLTFSSDDYKGLSCANSFHFIANRYKSSQRDIICFDIHTERFRTMELPLSGKGYFISLIMFKEFLSTVCISTSTSSTNIWIMKDYGAVKSWTNLYSIRPLWVSSKPLCFWTENDVLLWKDGTIGLSSCHYDTLKFEPIEIDGHNFYSQYAFYQETLVSII